MGAADPTDTYDKVVPLMAAAAKGGRRSELVDVTKRTLCLFHRLIEEAESRLDAGDPLAAAVEVDRVLEGGPASCVGSSPLPDPMPCGTPSISERAESQVSGAVPTAMRRPPPVCELARLHPGPLE